MKLILLVDGKTSEKPKYVPFGPVVSRGED
jgi:hypothetical protein